MLARLHEGTLGTGEWGFERKFDGQRVCAVNDPGSVHSVRLVTRNGIDTTHRYPDVVLSLPKDRSYVLDGELVAFQNGRESFPLLQRRMHSHAPDLSVPVHMVVFDCLNLDEQDTRLLPLRHRYPLLRELELGERCAVAPRVQGERGDEERLLERACKAGWEGLVAKRLDAPYVSRRSGDWLKLKCLQSGEFRVVGYTAPRGARSGFGAILVAEQTKEGSLRYAGKVGTGFDEHALDVLLRAMKKIRRARAPVVDPPREPSFWVDPVLVCRVGYSERTLDGRLRHPRFQGIVAPRAAHRRSVVH